MKDSMDDQELSARFRSLRREEAAQAPPFAVPERPLVSSWPRLLRAAAAIGLLVGAGATTLWLRQRRDTAARNQLALYRASTWVVPTDFLLETPGTDLLRRVPQIGIADVARIRAMPIDR
ncbi:MAG: hypothetical protein HY700_20635 [Gemmatimonadetes bacterium]|nr:hypothetical protein [Gemmatimonadota bacterium]